MIGVYEHGHQATCCEPRNNGSTNNLFATAQAAPILEFARRFPGIDVPFHDPHHRLASIPHQIVRFNLAACDGVLAFGESPARMYRTTLGDDDHGRQPHSEPQ